MRKVLALKLLPLQPPYTLMVLLTTAAEWPNLMIGGFSTQRNKIRERMIERERERHCVCVCVCMIQKRYK